MDRCDCTSTNYLLLGADFAGVLLDFGGRYRFKRLCLIWVLKLIDRGSLDMLYGEKERGFLEYPAGGLAAI